MQNLSDSSQDAPLVIFKHLYPAVLQSFAIILLGYSSSRWRLILSSQCQGLAKYISHFALPALLFQKMATLKFGSVDWLFWLSILIGKGMVFVLVFVVVVAVGMPRCPGTAGIFAIFATQTNDFALGYPIFAAVYDSTHPDLSQYVYLFGPISLLCLNPFGFLSLEIERNQNQPDMSKLRMVLGVLKGVITNPIMVSVLLGVAFNIIAHQRVPGILEPVVNVVADSFSAMALFYLGICLSGQLQKMSGKALLPVILLISAKLFVMPLILVLTVGVLRPGNSSNMTHVYANYAFLYGMMPTTPSVFIYATQYAISQDLLFHWMKKRKINKRMKEGGKKCNMHHGMYQSGLDKILLSSFQQIASCMFLCTFVSAPLMFLAGVTALAPFISQEANNAIVDRGSFAISCVGLVSSILLIGLFIKKKYIKTISHQSTSNLAISQIVITLAVIAGISTNNPVLEGVFVNVVRAFGTLASRCWAMLIAITLYIVKTKRMNLFNLRWFTIGFYLFGWGFPAVLTVTWFMLSSSPWKPETDFQEWEKQKSLGSICLHFLCLAVTLGALLGFAKVENLESRTDGEARRDQLQSDPTMDHQESHSSESTNIAPAIDCDLQVNVLQYSEEDTQLSNIPSSSAHLVPDCEEETMNDGHLQLEKHLMLVMLLAASMLVSLVLNILRLSVVDPYPGVLLVLCLLDGVLMYGQGFFAFLIFGLPITVITTRLQQCVPGRIRQFVARRSTDAVGSC